MILRRITLVGFKSFAAKTELELEAGITAVVGPNGSGKSNVADAIRWALGEQAKGRLRLTSGEEVIFAGTGARPRGSYAEVVLTFDNEDGAFPLELTEVEIARRLYRSGESEYRLAGRVVRLADITSLLATAGLNPGGYTVIGQGMIDSFLLSSPAERKTLFDEAAGIRGPELSREAALRKLAATEVNLTRLRDIATELEPRLATLSRVVATADEQAQLQNHITGLREEIAVGAHSYWSTELSRLATALDTAAEQAASAAAEQAAAAQALTDVQSARSATQAEQTQLQLLIAELEQTRDRAAETLAERRTASLQARQAVDLNRELSDRLTARQTELATALERETELRTELAETAAAAARALKTVETAAAHVTKTQAALVALRHDQTDSSRDQYLNHALEILKTLASGLGDKSVSDDQVKLLVHKAGRLLSHAAHRGASAFLADLQEAQRHLEAAMARRDTAVEHQTNITITARSLEIDLVHQHDVAARLADEVARLQADYASAELLAASEADLAQAVRATEADLALSNQRLEEARRRLRELSVADQAQNQEAELAAAVERAAAAQVAVALETERLEASRLAAEAAFAQARQQAADWSIELADAAAPHPPALDGLTDQQHQLMQAEAMLAARSTAQADQQVEYEALRARHTELTAQITDLETAAADLQSVIAELAALIQARFKDNFATLSTQFSAYFTQLFGGGSATLTLQEAENGQYGVDIQITPKGKRPTALAALSGGERAMAGVALLAAILRVNPSPFVVLDEIDAALDEANSGRLADILGELAEVSQLVVITHNRQTMQAASVLFGVTLNSEQVSHVLSLQLDQATALAAR